MLHLDDAPSIHGTTTATAAAAATRVSSSSVEYDDHPSIITTSSRLIKPPSQLTTDRCNSTLRRSRRSPRIDAKTSFVLLCCFRVTRLTRRRLTLIITLSALAIFTILQILPSTALQHQLLIVSNDAFTQLHISSPSLRPRDYLLAARAEILGMASSCGRHHTGDVILGKPARQRCGPKTKPSLWGIMSQNDAGNGDFRQKRGVASIRWALYNYKDFMTDSEDHPGDFQKDFDAMVIPDPFEEAAPVDDGVIFRSGGAINAGESELHCAVFDEAVPERFCRVRNLAVRVGFVPAVSDTTQGLELHPPFGAAAATCSLDERWWFHGNGFSKGGAGRWFHDALDILDPKTAIQCDAWVKTPLYFISRWDTTNPFQAHHDLLNTFAVLANLNISVSKIQPVLLDSRSPDGPYTSAYTHLFSTSHRLLDIRQLTSNLKPNATLCIRDSVWTIHGGVSSLKRGGRQRSECMYSPVLLSFRSFVIDRLRDVLLGSDAARDRSVALPVTPDVSDSATTTLSDRQRPRLSVTYAIRRNVTARSPIGGLGISAFDGLSNSTLRDRASPAPANQNPILSRQVLNQDALINELATVVKANGGKFRAVDFASLTFEEQIALAQSTDILIAPHGAVLIHLLYLRTRPSAGVLELMSPERRVGNEQFRNLAAALGHRYRRRNIGHSVKPEQLAIIKESLSELIKEVDAVRRDMRYALSHGRQYVVPPPIPEDAWKEKQALRSRTVYKN